MSNSPFQVSVEDLSRLDLVGVYSLRSPSSTFYVGMTFDSFRRRLAGHESLLSKGTHHCPALQSAVNKYGVENFKVQIEEAFDSQEITRLEIENIETATWDRFKANGASLYNARPMGGTTSHSEETRAIIRQRMQEAGAVKYHLLPKELIETAAADPEIKMRDFASSLEIPYSTLNYFCQINSIDWRTVRSRWYIEEVVFKELSNRIEEVKKQVENPNFSKAETAKILAVKLEHLKEFCDIHNLAFAGEQLKPSNRVLRDNIEEVKRLAKLGITQKEAANILDVNPKSLQFFITTRQIEWLRPSKAIRS